MEIKLGDIVCYDHFLYRNEIFLVVADRLNAWEKPSPFGPAEIINVEDGNDFILLKKDGDNFSVKGIDVNGLHVTKEKLKKITL